MAADRAVFAATDQSGAACIHCTCPNCAAVADVHAHTGARADKMPRESRTPLLSLSEEPEVKCAEGVVPGRTEDRSSTHTQVVDRVSMAPQHEAVCDKLKCFT